VPNARAAPSKSTINVIIRADDWERWFNASPNRARMAARDRKLVQLQQQTRVWWDKHHSIYS
jgi:hypothetical protein|tara:strand:- start:385 stop:570 length:186 start_codon:yes stop_codon:yes gene_type:complete